MPNLNNIGIEPANEDTIQCLFFSTIIGNDASKWQEKCKQLNVAIQAVAKDYIWQRDEFQVYLPIDDSECDKPFYLRSTTCFADNIEDEWYIVHILFELTKIHTDLIIQVKDNDGDFLLIEAANKLPPWASPETTENRVFIHNTHIHIIPTEVVSLQSKVELKNAINIVMQTPELTQASQEIEKAIFDRIGKYPENALGNIHTTVANLPSHLATLLKLNPSLIAPIVDAYCHHDMIEAKCCKNISFDDCILVEVKFTKFLYAMLTNSKLIPYVKHKLRQQNCKKNMIGLKLLCGFQIIMNKSTNTDLFSTKEYNMFYNNLKTNGYFKGNIEGSKEYSQLLSKAKDYFSTVECPMSTNVSHKILQLMSTDSFLKARELIINDTVKNDHASDNEDWLNIRPDQLNNLLETRYGKKSKFKKNDVISSEVITGELSNFLKQTSDFEGIETGIENFEDNDIDFEPCQFVNCLEKMLEVLKTGDTKDMSDTSDDDDDYEEDNISDDECDKELRNKLQTENKEGGETILANMVKSMREEKASTGPSSNLLRTIGVVKTDILDSDDDLSS